MLRRKYSDLILTASRFINVMIGFVGIFIGIFIFYLLRNGVDKLLLKIYSEGIVKSTEMSLFYYLIGAYLGSVFFYRIGSYLTSVLGVLGEISQNQSNILALFEEQIDVLNNHFHITDNTNNKSSYTRLRLKYLEELPKSCLINVAKQIPTYLPDLSFLYLINKNFPAVETLDLSKDVLSRDTLESRLMNILFFEKSYTPNLLILTGLINLKELSLRNQKIKKLSQDNWSKWGWQSKDPVGLCIHLDDSFLKNQSLPFSTLTSLTKLDLSGTKIDELYELLFCKNLSELNLSNTKIDSINELKQLKNLRKLNITQCKNLNENQIKDLIKHLPKCEIIH